MEQGTAIQIKEHPSVFDEGKAFYPSGCDYTEYPGKRDAPRQNDHNLRGNGKCRKENVLNVWQCCSL